MVAISMRSAEHRSWGPMWQVIALGLVTMYTLGIVASSLLIFAFAPLQRAAERIADSAMPGVRDTPEYTSYRKLQVYAAALESAYQEVAISQRERAMLVRIAESLGLHPSDAEQLERDVKARAGR